MPNDRSEAWQEGNAAWHEGLTDADNPYANGTDESMDWFDGWNAADNGGNHAA
ncbi:hypothetical protein [Burkholderia ubonensis]|uniref:hypothetical protein n=1 Tax=Burkholderia ubonensis TaxID=101571 RepID=UPI000AE1914A|nr:hypothetical protein [Burkholderia ubonensis]